MIRLSALLMLLALFALLAAPSLSAPVAMTITQEGATITLYDEKEPCALKGISNLPYRASWDQGGKRHEGCWGSHSGLVAAYWSDRTITIYSAAMFKLVQAL